MECTSGYLAPLCFLFLSKGPDLSLSLSHHREEKKPKNRNRDGKKKKEEEKLIHGYSTVRES
jgi:hypothetical protein